MSNSLRADGGWVLGMHSGDAMVLEGGSAVPLPSDPGGVALFGCRGLRIPAPKEIRYIVQKLLDITPAFPSKIETVLQENSTFRIVVDPF